MSMMEATGWSVLHATAACLVAVAIAARIVVLLRVVREREAWIRHLAWTGLLLPLLTPTLVVGYAYSGVALSFVRQPWLGELLYTALLVARLTPIATLALYFAPRPAVSSEARHVARLARPGSPSLWERVRVRGRSFTRRVTQTVSQPVTHHTPPHPGPLPEGEGRRQPLSGWPLWFRGPGRGVMLAATLVFLLAFGDFQLASLLGIPAWTVWMFDAQAGGLDLSVSLGYAIVPAGIELAMLALAVALLRGRSAAPSQGHRAATVSRTSAVAMGLYLAGSVALGTTWPFATLIGDGVGGGSALDPRASIWSEIGLSMAYALPAAAIAFVLAFTLIRQRLAPAAIIVSVPGMLGSLLLGLVLVALFQRLGPLYDTSVPILVALVLLTMPVAVLVVLLLEVTRDREALFLAKRIGAKGRGIVWRMVGRPRFWALALLFLLAVFDLGASALLAPSGRTPVTVRLYNLMHYGQSATLSAMVVATVLGVVAAMLAGRGVVGITANLWSRRA